MFSRCDLTPNSIPDMKHAKVADTLPQRFPPQSIKILDFLDIVSWVGKKRKHKISYKKSF